MKIDPLQEIKGLDAGHVLAITKAIGGRANVDAVLRGDLTIELKEAIKKLFDKHGRRIPKGLSAKICDANRDFYLKMIPLSYEADYADRIVRLHASLGIDTGIKALAFKQETKRLLALIRDNSQIVNITNEVWLPVVLPQLTTNDLGETLEQYLDAVGKSYVKTFSGREFINHRKGTLAGKVSVVDGSRHDQLIERMKQGPVRGIYFPNSLQGFSINASQEQMSTLPKGFISSGMDTIIAMVMYPDVLAYGSGTPGLDLAAFSWRSVYLSLYFLADDLRLGFNDTDGLANARGNCSGGLLFISPED